MEWAGWQRMPRTVGGVGRWRVTVEVPPGKVVGTSLVIVGADGTTVVAFPNPDRVLMRGHPEPSRLTEAGGGQVSTGGPPNGARFCHVGGSVSQTSPPEI